MLICYVLWRRKTRRVADDLSQRLAAFGYDYQVGLSLDLMARNMILGLVRPRCTLCSASAASTNCATHAARPVSSCNTAVLIALPCTHSRGSLVARHPLLLASVPAFCQYRISVTTRGGGRDDTESLLNSVIDNGVLRAEIARLSGEDVQIVPGTTTQALRAARETSCGAQGGAGGGGAGGGGGGGGSGSVPMPPPAAQKPGWKKKKPQHGGHTAKKKPARTAGLLG